MQDDLHLIVLLALNGTAVRESKTKIVNVIIVDHLRFPVSYQPHCKNLLYILLNQDDTNSFKQE